MTEPRRWLDDPHSSDSLEARLFSVAAELKAPAGLTERNWLDFMARLGPSAGAPGSAETTGHTGAASSANATQGLSGASASGLSTMAILKSLVIGLGLGTLCMTAIEALQSSPSPDSAAPHAAASGAPAPLRGERALPGQPRRASPAEVRAVDAPRVESSATPSRHDGIEPTRAVPAEVRESAAERAPASAPEKPANGAFPSPGAEEPAPSRARASENALQAEARELAEAKNLLNEGRAQQASSLLEQSAARFPAGALGHERELLSVQALMRLGKVKLARERARRFLEQFPNSPLAPRMRRSVLGE